MLTSQMGAPYVLFPIVLYAVVEFLRHTKPARLLAAVVAYVALFLTTFLPGGRVDDDPRPFGGARDRCERNAARWMRNDRLCHA